MTTTKTIPKPRSRWLQFSLRGLFLLMVVAAVAIGWTVHKLRQQQAAVAAVEKAGGRVIDDRAQLPEWLRTLFGDKAFRNVTGVIGGPQITDAVLVHLEWLNQLSGLYFERTQITDAGPVHLKGLTQFQVPDLSETQISEHERSYS